jgi:biotin-dependent carboxylase-like uncharacterized protein
VSATLSVIAPGLSSTVQDRGRFGAQRLGISVAGALDRLALAAANIVVGNDPDEAGIECLYQGPTLEITGAPVRLAVAGGGAELALERDGVVQHIAALTSVLAEPGVRVRVVMRGPAIAAVLAIEGGLDLAPVLRSRSTYARSGIGGFHGRALRTGDALALRRAAHARTERRLDGVAFDVPDVVRVVLGPQDDAFMPESVATFLDAPYVVKPVSDRMGLRLAGPRLSHRDGADIASDAIAWGSVQVPGDGEPIVLLADRQTTGGYTKIATVITADLPALSRAAPGHAVRFTAVSVEDAEALARAQASEIAAWPARLETVLPALDTARLLSLNLIDGVVSACDQPSSSSSS